MFSLMGCILRVSKTREKRLFQNSVKYAYFFGCAFARCLYTLPVYMQVRHVTQVTYKLIYSVAIIKIIL